ncbi:MAG: cytidylate kinase family protein [Deltaproteobacteria bacterium]|nr:cytidylate kinase family protein [Deltaproteobacteria bacterium]MCL5277707.1 cytidylate kinase family protein [Deltaproteobacteria bacterium]
MAIITISRGTFSGGEKLAECLSKRLGYTPVSREVILRAASEYGVSEENLITAMEKKPSLKERLALDLDRFHYLSFIQAALCEKAKDNNIIYHGHGGHLLLKGVSHVVKVKVIADMEQRIRFAMERNKFTREEAVRYIYSIDTQREKWTKFLYDVDWNDPSLYDIVVSLKKITIPTACEMIAVMVKADEFKTTEASVKAMNDLALASKVKAVLASDDFTKNFNVEVVADAGFITVNGKVDTMEDVDNITELVKNIKGVKGVSCKCHPHYLKDTVL